MKANTCAPSWTESARAAAHLALMWIFFLSYEIVSCLFGFFSAARGPIAEMTALADLSEIKKIVASIPASGKRAPLVWLAQDLYKLTQDADANKLKETFQFDTTFQYLSHLLHSVPIIDDRSDCASTSPQHRSGSQTFSHFQTRNFLS